MSAMESRTVLRVVVGAFLALAGLFLVVGGTAGTTGDSPIIGTWVQVAIVAVGALLTIGGASVSGSASVRPRGASSPNSLREF